MEPVRSTHHGAITVLELAREETGNALDAALIEALTAAVVAAAAPPTRALILTGAGKHFCSGANLAELATLAEAPAADRLADAMRLSVLYATLLRSPLLTVAAVRGAAYGGGLGLAAACDLVIASPDARLQFSEVRLGFVPALISVFLPRRMSPAALARVFLDPAPMTAAEAQALGLVDEIDDDPLSRALARAEAVARKAAPSAVAETKRLLLANVLPHLDAQLAHAARVNADQRAHPECRRGVAHFLATRSFPDWLTE